MKGTHRRTQQPAKLFCLAVFGVALSFFSYGLPPTTTAVFAQQNQSQQQTVDVQQQEQQARALYRYQQFSQAATQWERIAQTHGANNNRLGQASAFSNLALSYQALGQWDKAQSAIEASLEIVRGRGDESAAQPLLAQALMTLGALQLERGQEEQALDTWQQAENRYQQVGDRAGESRAQINQAQALRELGFYGRSHHLLQQVATDLEEEIPSSLKAVALIRLGDAFRLSGQPLAAEDALKQSLMIAQQINHLSDVSAALLSLGHLALEQSDFITAGDRYTQALATANDGELSRSTIVAIQLAQLSLYSHQSNWQAATEVSHAIQAQLSSLPLSRTSLYHQLHWVNGSLKIFDNRTTLASKQIELEQIELEQIAQQLQQVIAQARRLEDKRAEAYGIGTLGQLYERTEQWAEATQATQQALDLSDRIQAADIIYRWQWQLGRLWSSDRNPERSVSRAIEAYAQSVKTLSKLRGDLAAADTQFSFEENVEPVYRELVGLLLASDSRSPDYSQNITRAQSVIESLHIAELDNYFKEACADVQSVDEIQVDPNAAIVYTVVLNDHLSILLNLPHQSPQQFTVAVTATEVTQLAQQLRQQLVVRSRRDYFAVAEQAYALLIAPIRAALESSGVDTVVFVPDGPLRVVPLSALYDGDRFFVEDFAVGLTPSLKLMTPNTWSAADDLTRHRKQTLVAGLTESRAGFSSLPFVKAEVQSITETIRNSRVMINEDFTKDAIAQKLRTQAYPIVHIATHGKFSATPEETYLLAWDGRINVQEVNEMLQANLGKREGIELLMLSACETASSDPKAGLGLAGVALKAGASSTVGALWTIDDEATAHFVDVFYRQLMQPEMTRAKALRQTQITLLKDPQYQHPIYWAPYIMLGSWL